MSTIISLAVEGSTAMLAHIRSCPCMDVEVVFVEALFKEAFVAVLTVERPLCIRGVLLQNMNLVSPLASPCCVPTQVTCEGLGVD